MAIWLEFWVFYRREIIDFKIWTRKSLDGVRVYFFNKEEENIVWIDNLLLGCKGIDFLMGYQNSIFIKIIVEMNILLNSVTWFFLKKFIREFRLRDQPDLDYF